MYVLKDNGIDYSCHTVLEDAVRQRAILVNNGRNVDDFEIVESDSFNPDNVRH